MSTAATIVVNGNNISPGGDLIRRSILIELDAGVSDPSRRAFPRTFVEECAEARDDIIGDVLTCLAAFAQAGKPKAAKFARFGSFENWQDEIASALVWLGLPDPVATVGSGEAGDDQIEFFAGLLGQIGDLTCAKALTVEEILQDSATRFLLSEELGRENLSRRVGCLFRKYRNRVIHGKRLAIADKNRMGTCQWQVETSPQRLSR